MSVPLPVTGVTRTPALILDPRTYARGLACVHCGLCLPACPTYTETGNEADSPRGRIQLMLGLADGRIGLTDSVKHHLDLCLDCRGCETACPSGVVYHELIEETRQRFAQLTGATVARPTLADRFLRWTFLHVLTHATRLKLAMLPARVMQKVGLYQLLRKLGLFRLLPVKLQKMEQMLPARGKLWPARLPEHTRGTGLQPVSGKAEHGLKTRTTTVGFLAGCIGSVIFEKVNRQTVELLRACGADVIVPRAQGCCGAIHNHNGEHARAQELARRNIDAFSRQWHLSATAARDAEPTLPDMIVTNVAGCGAMLREYDVLLRDDPLYARRAADFVARVRDVSEALLELGPLRMTHIVDATVTYHDACHLAHGQRVTAAPRALLAKISGLRLVPLPESDMCCGAAGTYNLEHPEMATSLADRKLDNVAATGAPTCATGNVGCAMHIQSRADARGQRVIVVHPVELLHRAVFGE